MRYFAAVCLLRTTAMSVNSYTLARKGSLMHTQKWERDEREWREREEKGERGKRREGKKGREGGRERKDSNICVREIVFENERETFEAILRKT